MPKDLTFWRTFQKNHWQEFLDQLFDRKNIRHLQASHHDINDMNQGCDDMKFISNKWRQTPQPHPSP